MRPFMTGQLFMGGGTMSCMFSVYEYPEAALRNEPARFKVSIISPSAGHIVVEDNGPLTLEQVAAMLDDHRDW